MSPKLLKWTIGLAVVVALPLLGKWARRDDPPCCARDGQRIEPLFRVRFVEDDAERVFCSVACAEFWLARPGHRPRAILVTDEASGQELRAAQAYFVRSAVVTPPTRRNRTHAFAQYADAARHASAFRGVMLLGADRPFGGGP